MILTRENLAHYLLDRGLLDLEETAGPFLHIVEAPHKNRNFLVHRGEGRTGYFVKQARYWEPHTAASVAVEARCLSAFAREPAFAELRPSVPRLEHHDRERAALVVQLTPRAESLAEHYRREGRYSLDVAADLGRAIGTIHRCGTAAVVSRAGMGLPTASPWILMAPTLDGVRAGARSGAGHQLFDTVRGHAAYGPPLARLRASWRPETLVHGDLKWENCLVRAQPEGEPASRLSIVDWELACLGSSWWDVGGILQSYLLRWVSPLGSTPHRAGSDDDLAAVSPSITHFWRAYADTLELPARHRSALLEQSIAGAGARLIQTALELSARDAELSELAVTVLQLASNLLLEPRRAARDLLRLEPSHSAASVLGGSR